MTNTMKAQAQEIINMGVKAGMSAEDIGKLLKTLGFGSTDEPEPEHTSAKKGSPKLVEFVKADGTVVKCTAAQAAAWGKFRDASGERKAAFEEMKAGWATKREAYKPSKALVDAIKKDRASITRKIAKEQYGFVGTKDDLKALKDSICK